MFITIAAVPLGGGRGLSESRILWGREVSQRQLGDTAAGSIETDILPEADWGKLRNCLIVASHHCSRLKFLG
jgi:hypothetical protein